MPQILSNPMAKDHRTGLEICKCVQSFLTARRVIFPPPSLPKPAARHESQDSQDEYGDGGLDLNDPALLAVLADIEDRPDENDAADHIASEVGILSFSCAVTYNMRNSDPGCLFSAALYLSLHASWVQIHYVWWSIL
jgi:hypothetical protein